jgi:hypothetical protein
MISRSKSPLVMPGTGNAFGTPGRGSALTGIEPRTQQQLLRRRRV